MGVNATACAPSTLRGPERDRGGWSEPLGAGHRAPSAEQTVPAELAALWRAGVGRAAAGQPALGDSVIAVLALDRTLSLLVRSTGERVWRARLDAPGVGAPLIVGDRVYAATGGRQGRVYAFALRTGRRHWRQPLAFATGSIAATPGTVLAATESGRVVGLDASDGAARWTRRLAGPVRAGVVLFGDEVFVASDDTLYVLDLAEGSVRRHAAAPVIVAAIPAVLGDTLVATSPDGQIVGIDLRGPTLRWTVPTGSPIFGGPSVARDTVFAVTLDGAVWQVPLRDPTAATADSLHVAVRATPAPTRSGVLVGTLAGELLLVRGASVERKARVDGPIEQAPVVDRGILYVIDGKGRLHAWR